MPIKRTKYFLQQSWLLIVSSFFFGLLIALASAAWSPRIQENKTRELKSKIGDLFLSVKCIELAAQLDLESAGGGTVRSDIYRAVSAEGQCVGWAFTCAGMGFGGRLELVVAVDRDFKTIVGFDCLANNETPGFGDRVNDGFYRNQFMGAPAGGLEIVRVGDDKKIDDQIVAITGATVSSEAVVNIINNSLAPIKTCMEKEGLIGNSSQRSQTNVE